VTRRRSSRNASAAPAAFGYVRSTDTPVLFHDVVAALGSLASAAARSGEREVVDAALHVESLAQSLRSQFVDDVVGPRLPSQTAVAVDRERSRERQADVEDEAATRLRPDPSRVASNS
jgi:hypothetical protein